MFADNKTRSGAKLFWNIEECPYLGQTCTCCDKPHLSPEEADRRGLLIFPMTLAKGGRGTTHVYREIV